MFFLSKNLPLFIYRIITVIGITPQQQAQVF